MRYIVALLALLFVSSAFANPTYVKPHVRKDGTFVQGHYRTSPNNTKLDNWSTEGNVNPYTGKAGTVDPYALPKPTYKNLLKPEDD